MTQSILAESPARRLRALIDAPDILAFHGVFDGFSARLVEKVGYTAAFITGIPIPPSTPISPTSRRRKSGPPISAWWVPPSG